MLKSEFKKKTIFYVYYGNFCIFINSVHGFLVFIDLLVHYTSDFVSIILL